LNWDPKSDTSITGKKRDYEKKTEMKFILKNYSETPKKEIISPNKPISNAFPNGKFEQNSSNPYRLYSDLKKKTYIDKYSNMKETIRDNKSLKVYLNK